LIILPPMLVTCLRIQWAMVQPCGLTQQCYFAAPLVPLAHKAPRVYQRSPVRKGPPVPKVHKGQREVLERWVPQDRKVPLAHKEPKVPRVQQDTLDPVVRKGRQGPRVPMGRKVHKGPREPQGHWVARATRAPLACRGSQVY
jgi:hypothetical protein